MIRLASEAIRPVTSAGRGGAIWAAFWATFWDAWRGPRRSCNAKLSVAEVPRGVFFGRSKKRHAALALRNMSHPRIGVWNARRRCFGESTRNRPKSGLWGVEMGCSFWHGFGGRGGRLLETNGLRGGPKGRLAGQFRGHVPEIKVVDFVGRSGLRSGSGSRGVSFVCCLGVCCLMYFGRRSLVFH